MAEGGSQRGSEQEQDSAHNAGLSIECVTCQGNQDFSVLTTSNWILQTTWMTLILPQSALKGMQFCQCLDFGFVRSWAVNPTMPRQTSDLQNYENINSCCFALLISNYSLMPFHFMFTWGLLAMNFLSFCLSEDVLVLSSFLKCNFSGYIILGWQSFFSSLNLSLSCFLASLVSDHGAFNLIEDHLYMMNYVSPVAFKILSFSLDFKSLIRMCLGVDPFEFILHEVCWASWIYKF